MRNPPSLKISRPRVILQNLMNFSLFFNKTRKPSLLAFFLGNLVAFIVHSTQNPYVPS